MVHPYDGRPRGDLPDQEFGIVGPVIMLEGRQVPAVRAEGHAQDDIVVCERWADLFARAPVPKLDEAGWTVVAGGKGVTVGTEGDCGDIVAVLKRRAGWAASGSFPDSGRPIETGSCEISAVGGEYNLAD
jgi:hypothetical protein